MIEVKPIDKGCRRLLDLRRFTKIVKQMPVNVRVHWHVADDTIYIILPDEHKLNTKMFTGLTDNTIMSWIMTIICIRRDRCINV